MEPVATTFVAWDVNNKKSANKFDDGFLNDGDLEQL